MIDRDTLRTARRTVERNGFTVLPPRDRDERDLNRFRTRREVEKEGNEDYRPTRQAPRFRDAVEEDEQPRRFKPLRQREYDEEDYEPRRTARPSRKVEDDYDNEPQRQTRQVRPSRPVEDDYDDEPRRPAQRPTRSYREEEDYDYEPRRTARPAPRREMNDDEKLGAAIRTAEENGFTIRKMSKLDQAKQVARDNGFEVRRADDDDDAPRRPTRRPVDATVDGGNDRPARTVPGRAQRPLVRPKANPTVNDGIRTRTAPDTEIKGNVDTTATQTQEPAPAAATEPRCPRAI